MFWSLFMANLAPIAARQSLLKSIRSQVDLAERMLAHKRQLLSGEGQNRISAAPKDLQSGEAYLSQLKLTLGLSTKKKMGRAPGSASAAMTYNLSVVFHTCGPIWVKTERRFSGYSLADINKSTKVTLWKLLSEEGDLSDWRGEIWGSFWPTLMDDMDNIVPGELENHVVDGDMWCRVEPGTDFWTKGRCKLNRSAPLEMWSFEKEAPPAPQVRYDIPQVERRAA